MSDANERQQDYREPDDGELDVDVEHGTIPTDTRGGGGIGTADGVSGVGTVGPDFGIAGNVPEPPGVDTEPVTIDDEGEEPDALADPDETGDDTIP